MKAGLHFFVPAALSNEKSEKIKNISAFFMYCLHHTLYSYKPFDPFLGETFQTIIKSDNASEGELFLYCEQTSTSPSVFNFYGKHELFTIWGTRQSIANGNGNSVTANIVGLFNIKFKDGTHITFEYGPYFISGILVGQRKAGFKGNFIVKDHTNNLITVIEIQPEETKGIFGKIFGKKTQQFPDYFKGFITNTDNVVHDKKKNIFKLTDSNAIISKIEGEYISYINIDDKSYWKSGDNFLADQHKMKFVLPSDSRYRQDILLYKNGNIELAQYAKTWLTQLFTWDTQLRKQANS